MTRLLPLLLSTALLVSHSAMAADRTLAAEGDYVAQKDRKKSLAHWKLWHLQNGEYEVAENLAGQATLRFCPRRVLRSRPIVAHDRDRPSNRTQPLRGQCGQRLCNAG